MARLPPDSLRRHERAYAGLHIDGPGLLPQRRANANPNLANSTSWVSQGVGLYNALEIDVRRSYANGVQFRGNYTWSKNLDDGSAWNTSVSGNTPAYVEFPLEPKARLGPGGDRRAPVPPRSTAATTCPSAPTGASSTTRPGRWASSPAAGPPARSSPSRPASRSRRSLATTRPATATRAIQSGPVGTLRSRGNLYPRTAGEYFNPNAFIQPTVSVPNSERRQHDLRHLRQREARLARSAPGSRSWISRRSRIRTSPSGSTSQFRAEFFNILNHTNFLTPNEVVYSSAPTITTAGRVETETPSAISPTAGVVTATSTTSRQIQFGAKLQF